MSDNKPQPSEDTFDDVTGHAIRSGRALPEEDTEGHAVKPPKPKRGQDDDTEGHARASIK